MGLGKYLKRAFTYHWNLLALGAGTVFALLSGQPDVVLPVVAAVEIAYLGLLATNERFQKAIEAEEAKEKRATTAVSTEEAFRKITRALPPESLRRYEALRTRVRDLRQIGQDLRRPGGTSGRVPFDNLQVQGLDRLLWIFLRLLYTEWSLRRFLDRTSEDRIRADIEVLERRLEETPEDPTNPRRQKAREAIEDTLQTSRSRLENLLKAHENYELVQLEIDRLDNKIRSLSEMVVNREEPEFISDQVDSVASSMIETERTMDELRFATGLLESDEAVPELLNRPTLQTKGR